MSDNQIREEVIIDMKQVGVAELERRLQAIMRVIGDLPPTASAAQGPIQNLLALLSQINPTLSKGFQSKEAFDTIKKIGQELSALKKLAEATDLFSGSQLKAVEDEMRAVNRLQKAYSFLQKEKALANGEYGLDSKNIREAERKLRDLDQAFQRRAGQLAGGVGNAENLKAEQVQIQANTAALQRHIETMREQAKLAKAQTEALAMNATKDKKQEKDETSKRQSYENFWLKALREREIAEAASEQKLIEKKEQQRLQSEDRMRTLNLNGERQAQLEKIKLYSKLWSDLDRIQQSRQTELFRNQQKGYELQLNEERKMQYKRIEGERRQQYEMYKFNRDSALRDSFKFVKDDGAGRFQRVDQFAPDNVKQKQQEILGLQNQLVDRIKAGNLGDAEKAQLLATILAKKKEELTLTANLSNKEREAEQIARARARTQGAGGAALLMIQTSLMANYALLGGVVSGLRNAVSTSVEYEAALKNVQAVTATTNTEMRGLDKTIRDVAASSKFSSIEVANAALILGQAGLSAEQVGKAIGPVVGLATAAGSNIANAVDLVTSVIGVFDKTAADTADIANKITQAANDSKISVEKLALAFQYVGNTASQTGITFEETTAALATMSNAGIKSGSTMGTGLRQFLVEVQKPSQEFINILTKLGLSINDIDFKANSFVGIAKKLREAGFTATDAIKSFDVRGAAAFNALIANPEEFEKQYQSLVDSKAAIEANAIQMDSLQSQSQRLKTSLGNLAVEGFAPLSALLKNVFSGLASFAQALSQTGPLVMVLGTALGALVAARTLVYITSLVQGFVQLGGVVGVTQAAMATLGSAFGVTATAAGGATVAVGGLTAATGGLVALTGGLLVVLGAAGYWTYNKWATDAAEKTDRLKASISDAKGKFDEKADAVKSLDNKIASLTMQQGELKDRSDTLKTEIIAANSKYAQWGRTIDVNKASLKDLINELQNLRSELNKLALADMQTAVNKTEELAEEKVKQTKKSYDQFKYGNPLSRASGSMGQLESLLNADGGETLASAGLTPNQLADLRRNLESVRKSNGKPEELFGPAYISQILGRVDKTKLNSLQNDAIQEIIKQANELADVAAEARDAERKRVEGQNKVTQGKEYLEADKVFAKAKASGGKTFSEFKDQQFNLDLEAKARLNPEDAKNPVRLEEAARSLWLELRKGFEAAKEEIKGLPIADSAKKTMGQELEDKLSKLRNQYERQVDFAKGLFEDENSMKNLTAKAEMAVISRNMKPGTASEEQYRRGRLIISEQAGRDLAKANFGLDPDSAKFKLNTKESKLQLDEKLQQFDDKWKDVLRQISENSLKIEEQSLKSAVEASLRRAKEKRTRANSNMTIDQIDTLAKDGLKDLAEGYAMEKAALETKIERQRTHGGKNVTAQMEAAWANELSQLDDKWNSAMDTHLNGFNDLLSKSADHMYNLTKKIKALKAKMDRAAREAEEKLYAADESLRAQDMKLATATGPVSSRASSETEAFLLQRQREPLALESVRRQIVSDEQLKATAEAALPGWQSTMAARQQGVDSLEKQKADFLNGRSSETLRGEDREYYNKLEADYKAQANAATQAEQEVANLQKRIEELRNKLTGLRQQEAGMTPGNVHSLEQQDIENAWKNSWERFKIEASEMNPAKVLTDGMSNTLGGLKMGFADLFESLVTKSKSAGDAFKDFARGIVKSMLDIMAQALAMQAVRGIFSFMGIALGAGSAGATPGVMDAGITAMPTMAATGGFINQKGRLEPVKRFAGGGPVFGGVAGRDSVPSLLMPGEFVLRKSAVDAVGTDYLHSLNQATSSVVSSSSPRDPAAPANSSGVVNIYVVSPDQQPSGMGPKDVIVTIADDIARGGSVKQLIKQVQLGQV